MRFVLFYHSVVSDWNHGNAHFLRGIVAELLARGHDVEVLEPADGWSVTNLVHECGPGALAAFHHAFPQLSGETYDVATLDLDRILQSADVVIAHEWTSGEVLTKLRLHRARHSGYRLLFHDTHHRAVSDPDALATFGLDGFDGVLAFGASLKARYEQLGWGRSVWVWHEAADTRTFYPHAGERTGGDLIWIGNWGDEERAQELTDYLLEPVATLTLRGRAYGVRYPLPVQQQLAAAGIEYRGWLPNYRTPELFARFRATVHIPRRPYLSMLPGIPTIRPFEALACGIPLISARWDDVEGLFRPDDFVMVRTGTEMKSALRLLINDVAAASQIAARGLETIRARHTCAHRVDELFAILQQELSCPYDRGSRFLDPASCPRSGTAPQRTTAESSAALQPAASM